MVLHFHCGRTDAEEDPAAEGVVPVVRFELVREERICQGGTEGDGAGFARGELAQGAEGDLTDAEATVVESR